MKVKIYLKAIRIATLTNKKKLSLTALNFPMTKVLLLHTGTAARRISVADEFQFDISSLKCSEQLMKSTTTF